MSSSKFIIIFATLAFDAIIEAAPIQEIHEDSEIAAKNPTFNLSPRIPAPVVGAPAIVAPISAPKLPGNLGINGNRWGASLLPKLENVVGGLISGIPAIPARQG
uniref:Uncharacterized protein n=1 Tax=Panagrolaimus sp. ES5 TaxID=591445 RepID=A0AC34G4P0_9BILA